MDFEQDNEKKEILYQNEILDKQLKEEFAAFYFKKNSKGTS